jgi:hypothetical protein
MCVLPSVSLPALSASLIFLTAVSSSAAEQAKAGVSAKPETQAAEHPEEIVAITKVATRATEVADLIRSFNTKLTADAGIKAISESLPDTAMLIDLEASTTLKLLQQQPPLDSLERQQLLWRQRQIVTTTWLNALTERATLLQEVSNLLAELEKTWSATRAEAQRTNAPQPILHRIDETLAAIATEEAPIDAQRSAVLDLQARVAKEVGRCGNVLAEVDRFQQLSVAGILVRDGQPIWSAELWAQTRRALSERIRKLVSAYRADLAAYVRDSRGLMLHLALFAVLALIFWAARRKVDRMVAADEPVSSSAIEVFRSPLAASLLFTLVLLTSPFSREIPISVRELLQILACMPMILLIRPIAGTWLMRRLYSLSALFAIDTVRSAIAEGAPIDQTILLLETVMGIVLAGGCSSTPGGHGRS